ncbi:PIN domain-containing protein [Treponema socranskii]|uniref:PIN domain-containing protein n=1 Tax=Treponema socranskii TaxID=53419 RepID=UPI003D92CB65
MKRRIYLDTSVISFLKAEDSPEKMHDTVLLWDDIKNNTYDVIISDLTIKEIEQCPEPKRTYMLNELRKIEMTVVQIENDVDELSKDFIDAGILKEKSFDDCRHIATAIMAQCDIIVSWNFKHIVNDKTIDGIKRITNIRNLPEIKIYCPSMLIGGSDE